MAQLRTLFCEAAATCTNSDIGLARSREYCSLEQFRYRLRR